MLKTFSEARIELDGGHASFTLSETNNRVTLSVEDWFEEPRYKMLHLVQLCTSPSPRALIPMVECLTIVGFSRPPEEDGIDPGLWREVLRPFTAVKDLYLSPKLAPRVALVLQDFVGESAMGLLPALQNIFLIELRPTGFVPEGIEQFVAARQLANHPTSVSHCRLEKYY
jgi:hypothetical protein